MSNQAGRVMGKQLLRLSALFFFLFSAMTAFAQDCENGPGLPGDDPDATSTGCDIPLDTWVVVLVIAALIFTTVYLYKKQKTEAAV